MAAVTTIDRVRLDLAARVAAIDCRAPYVAPGDLVGDVDAVRVIALRNGLDRAVAVAQSLGRALSYENGSHDDGGMMLYGRLAMLSEAVTSDRHDLAAA